MRHFDAVVRRKRFILSSEKEKKTPPYSKVDEKKTLSLPASSPVPRRRPLERIECEGDDDDDDEEEEDDDDDEEFRGVKSVGKRKARRTNASTRDSSDSDLGWVEEHDRRHKVKKTTSFELGTPERKSELPTRKSERQQAQIQKRREERRSFKKKMTTKKKDRLEDSSEGDTAESYEEGGSESEADDEMDKNMRQDLDRAIDNMHGWKRRVWKNRSNVNPASKDTSALPTGGWNGTIY